MNNEQLSTKSQPFLNYLEDWLDQLPTLSLEEATVNPENCAVFSVDITNGFCNEGALASPRVANIVTPIVRLFEAAWSRGIKNILLINDAHEPDALEFSAFPPHCVRGTSEAEPVNEIKDLPYFNQMVILEKNSVAPRCNSGLEQWMSEHGNVDTFIVVGDCTDICTYQLALYLLTDANARQLKRSVIIPADCVDTYDRSLETAQTQGGMAHPGDLFHAIFLYHMALNGIKVIKNFS